MLSENQSNIVERIRFKVYRLPDGWIYPCTPEQIKQKLKELCRWPKLLKHIEQLNIVEFYPVTKSWWKHRFWAGTWPSKGRIRIYAWPTNRH